MASREYAHERGLRHVEFLSGRSVGAQPDLPGAAPIIAIRSLLENHQLKAQELTFAEIMEAFAAQAILCQRGAKIPESLVNQTGGALAWGHPVGASGAILAVNAFDRLIRSAGTGLVAIAAAGGIGSAALLKRGARSE